MPSTDNLVALAPQAAMAAGSDEVPLLRSMLPTGAVRRILASAAICAALSACSGMEDLFVAPGKYAIYTCEELETAGRRAATREHELKGLMSRAEKGSGGAVVNALAYRTEYLETQGQLKQLEQMAMEKRCDTPWRTQSDRSMW